MTPFNPITGVLIDDVALTIDELARACCVERNWIQQHVEDGFLQCTLIECNVTFAVQDTDRWPDWRFASRQLIRARKLVAFERDFDANPELAALLVDLLEEIAELKRRSG